MPEWIEPVARGLLIGLKTTVLLTLASMAASVAAGIVLGLIGTLGRFLGWAVRAYVEVFRALPVLVVLFIVFFGLPFFGWVVTTLMSAMIALTLWGSANVAEITRGAVQSLPEAQFEAADAVGMRWHTKMIYVVLPQTVRRMTPSLMGTVTQLIQATALASAIGVLELIEAGSRSIERLSNQTGSSHALAIMGFILIIYFVISFPLTQLSRLLEYRLENPRPRTDPRRLRLAGRALPSARGR